MCREVLRSGVAPATPFQFVSLGILAYIGGNSALAQVRRRGGYGRIAVVGVEVMMSVRVMTAVMGRRRRRRRRRRRAAVSCASCSFSL